MTSQKAKEGRSCFYEAARILAEFIISYVSDKSSIVSVIPETREVYPAWSEDGGRRNSVIS